MTAENAGEYHNDWRCGTKVRIVLDTDYEVNVEHTSFGEDLDHLAQALIGEHLLPSLAHDSSWEIAVGSTRVGIEQAITGLSDDECRLLASWMLFNLCCEKLEKMGTIAQKRRAKVSPKKKPKRKRRRK